MTCKKQPGCSVEKNRIDSGFSIIEILVVLTIIGMLVSIVGPRVLGYLSDSKIKSAKIQLDSLAAALDLYYFDTGRYPTTSESLHALLRRPNSSSNWNGPYIRSAAIPKDPWGNAYIYKFPGQKRQYDLFSLGPGGKATNDPISTTGN